MVVTVVCPDAKFAKSMWVRSRRTARREVVAAYPWLQSAIFAWWIQ